MSETQDLPIYNIYDYLKTIYIYSHVKTYLIDPDRQSIEFYFDIALLLLSSFFLFFSLFKLATIVIYLIVIQSFSAFIAFINSLFRLKFKIKFCSSFKNGMNYLWKIFKRIGTFNFYLYENNIVGAIMILSYCFYILFSFYFFLLNLLFIKEVEKSKEYMHVFYLHFESFILIQLLCSCFYALRNTNLAVICAFGIFIFLNLTILFGYLTTEKLENVIGKFEHNEPEEIMNIVINIILLLLNGNCLFNISFKRKGKYKKIIYLYINYRY